MTDLSLKLSAYLDGELPPDQAAEIAARLETDPTAQAELEALVTAQIVAETHFEEQLQHPLPLDLIRKIKSATEPRPAPTNARPIRRAIAAGLMLVTIGGAGGYLYRANTAPIETAGWLADIADYHGVYAGQTRHLVEVGADEAAHIETWLGNTIEASFSIPDLSEFELTFEGGRLLVANGKPVAQLMYRMPDGTVVALCLQRTASPNEAAPTFAEQTINGFDFVTWRGAQADYVVIGPTGQSNLTDIAAVAASEI